MTETGPLCLSDRKQFEYGLSNRRMPAPSQLQNGTVLELRQVEDSEVLVKDD